MQEVFAYLNADPLRHLPHLKFLHIYPDAMTCHYVEVEQAQGVLVAYDTHALPWDRIAYPQAKQVFMPATSSPAVANVLLAHILAQFPTAFPAVFKFCDDVTRDIFMAALPLRLMRTLVSYTGQRVESLSDDSSIVIRQELDADLQALFAENGYTSDDLALYFADGAFALALYEQAKPVSVCFIYRNYEKIWEIAGVYTCEDARRKGCGRRVVQKALHTILTRGLTPRYQAEATNLASLGLAESLGLTPCLRFEHYLSETLSPGNG